MGDALKIVTIFGQIMPMHIVKSRLIGASLSEPHINCTSMRAVFIYIMVRPSPARRFIHLVLRPHAMFSAVKSAWSKQLRHSALI